jgi:hypothetical protein
MVYVKDERSNLQTCANALTSITSCTNLVLLEPFDGSYLGHAFSKFCPYTITHEKMFFDFLFASIKAMINHFKMYYMAKEVWKKVGKHGKKTCIEFGLQSKKLNTPMKTR